MQPDLPKLHQLKKKLVWGSIYLLSIDLRQLFHSLDFNIFVLYTVSYGWENRIVILHHNIMDPWMRVLCSIVSHLDPQTSFSVDSHVSHIFFALYKCSKHVLILSFSCCYCHPVLPQHAVYFYYQTLGILKKWTSILSILSISLYTHKTIHHDKIHKIHLN